MSLRKKSLFSWVHSLYSACKRKRTAIRYRTFGLATGNSKPYLYLGKRKIMPRNDSQNTHEEVNMTERVNYAQYKPRKHTPLKTKQLNLTAKTEIYTLINFSPCRTNKHFFSFEHAQFGPFIVLELEFLKNSLRCLLWIKLGALPHNLLT